MNIITYRHEQKIEITPGDLPALRMRLRNVMKTDSHAPDGRYHIRSLYFDNDRDKALREKLDGINCREKFRLRYYNHDTEYIRLEKKSKINGLCRKDSVQLTSKQTMELLKNPGFYRPSPETDTSILCPSSEASPLLQEFVLKIRSQGLKPKTLVDYTREAYVFTPGNVRITLDYNIRTGLCGTDFLNPDCIMVPAGDAPAILEVKWDEYLPDIIRDLIQMPHCRVGAFSKYAACRIYG